MAKAKKPAAGNKSRAGSSKANATKAETGKTPETAKDTPSKASQAAKAKSDPTTSAKPEAKTTEPPKADVVAEKKAVDPAPKTASKEPAKAADAKVDPKTASKPSDPKPAEPAKGETKEPAKPAAKVPSKTEAKDAAKPEVKEPPKTEPKKTPEPVKSTPSTVTAPPPEKSRGGLFPLVLGGLIAGGIGFAAAEMNVLGLRPDLDALRATLAAQQEQIDAFEPADLTGVEAGLAEANETATGLEGRIVELEARPVFVADDGTALSMEDLQALAQGLADQRATAYEKDLAALKGSVEGLLDNARDVEVAIEENAREAAIQAATAKLTAALSAGAPYADVLNDLSEAGISDIPPALTDTADTGVATLLTLQTEFPSAARDGLEAARASGVDAGTGGVGGFLRRQLKARSTAPRDGNDPDAILSRAEAAVRGGDVRTALTEVDALPEEVQGAMEGWLAQARTRAETEQAVEDLSERLTAN